MSLIYDYGMSEFDSTDSGREPHPHLPPPPPPPNHAATAAALAKKKKKKKPVPPQEAINKIWSRFSAPKFSKATAILPFVPKPTRSSFDPAMPLPVLGSPKQDNLLVSEDYERAVKECRIRVTKLIKECRRVNMRYRDPEFDIDWDLKYAKGNCLNNLAKKRYDMTGRSLRNPTSDTPKAAKRIHEIFEQPTFLKEKPSPADIKQGDLGDCWLMASLTALANVESGIQRICVEYDTKIGIYGFVFHRDGEWIISIIDDKLYLKSSDWDSPSVLRHLLEQIDREDVEKEYRKLYQTGSKSLTFAQNKDQNETWLPLLEKAYAKAHGDFGSLWGGWGGEGIEDLTGGVTTELLTSDILDVDEFWQNEIMNVNKEFLFGCYTGIVDGGYGEREGIAERHAYVIMEARELSTGQRLVKLRNPWGKPRSGNGNWQGAWSDGSKEFTPDIQKELDHKFGNDSVFWISFEDLLRKYLHLDRTRLFMDCPDWRITQKWISMDVPWKADYSQKFKITLKKESPIVIVLSQLDDRYFQGLTGQYTFRLQFRVHEVGSPDENDFVVRSHGNYVMERSVVTELKSLLAGEYTVFVMVAAERNKYASSVEQLVKEETRRRSDNDKLAQVGMSYDLAHSKAIGYNEERTRVQQLRDKLKAREARHALRFKNWEKRRTSDRITRKQEKKNKAKRDIKEAKSAAEAQAKRDEAQAKLDQAPKDKSVQTDDVEEVSIVNEDKGMQTEDLPQSSAESDKTVTPMLPVEPQGSDLDKGVQTDDTSSIGSQCTPVTPKGSSRNNSPQPGPNRVMTIPHYTRSVSPPPHMRGRDDSAEKASRDQRSRQRRYITSEGESSASPISDHDDLFSDDEPNIKVRHWVKTGVPALDGKAKKGGDDSDDENLPEPWNAVCIVGLRVYSQDPELELVISEEGMEIQAEGGGEEDEGTDGDVEDSDDEETKPKRKDDEPKVQDADIVDNSKEQKSKIEESKTGETKSEDAKSEDVKGKEAELDETKLDQVSAHKVKEPTPKRDRSKDAEIAMHNMKLDEALIDDFSALVNWMKERESSDQKNNPVQENGASSEVTMTEHDAQIVPVLEPDIKTIKPRPEVPGDEFKFDLSEDKPLTSVHGNGEEV